MGLRNNPGGSDRTGPALLSDFQCGNVGIDLRLEHVEGQRPIAQHGVVEVANVKPGAECLLGFPSQPLNLELAELVGERLTRPCDVTIDFGERLLRHVLREILAGTITRPSHGVDSRIDDEPHAAKLLAGKLTESRRGIAVYAQICPE